ncbi:MULTISPECIES: hypothetical protein [unclassified Breznakia]|uniref:hypothetical protein n=1 Tax=unclassified Breznakia TaxID=2623764 RepID=UPI002475979B|nr:MULTISPECIES: hypothetical protein [unclassified Breznakia]MDH6365962.1 hypothetical protein [Breznakia sp. PH1-1]MDH6403106.1 hypothetical protein [Breznakia sp. PF1-11]MDH6410815.1 hypothetical protein [Breznakia sp. PFB1-11]MDH6413128.1 hypothetical protein [Breznakia sp. PFB1-14]MDH6415496.1 hypothetical protein [Breznakia sp. PFB1-4]
MNRGAYYSSHKLSNRHDLKGRIISLIIGWTVFIILFSLSKYEPFQEILLEFSLKMNVSWITSVIDFILNGFWFLCIPMITGTIITLLNKKIFDEIQIYEHGLRFINKKTGSDTFVTYHNIKCSYGKQSDSFWITVKEINLNNRKFYWNDFTDDVNMKIYMMKFIIFEPY